MFIQTESTSNPETMKFLPGQPVLNSETADFPDDTAAAVSPLAGRIFEVEGVAGVFLDPDSITVTKTGDKDWQVIKPAILGAIMEHFTSGAAAIEENATAESALDDAEMDSEVAIQVKELIDTRIKPAAAQDGGDDRLQGPSRRAPSTWRWSAPAWVSRTASKTCSSTTCPRSNGSSTSATRFPSRGSTRRKASPSRSFSTRTSIRPVAGHGGHISLVDVKADTVYIRLEGGCQGCGMADVTLKQGVEVEIKNAVPSIVAVLDVTDHADGSNPYYQPGKGGM